MKQFNWAKVPNNKVTGTVWAGVDDSKMTIDVNELEDLFGVKTTPVVAKDVAKPVKKAQTVLLDPKRSNNCAIMLSRFKISFAEIKQAILTFDESILTLDVTGYLSHTFLNLMRLRS